MATPKWVCMVIFALLTFTVTFADDDANAISTPLTNLPSPPLTPTVPSPPPSKSKFSMNKVTVPPLYPFPLRPRPIIPFPPPSSPSRPPSETVPYPPPSPPHADTNTQVHSFPSVSKQNVPSPPPPSLTSSIFPLCTSSSAWTNGGDGGGGSAQVSGDAPGYEGSKEGRRDNNCSGWVGKGGASISTSGFAKTPRMGGKPNNDDANMWGRQGGLHSGSNPSNP